MADHQPHCYHTPTHTQTHIHHTATSASLFLCTLPTLTSYWCTALCVCFYACVRVCVCAFIAARSVAQLCQSAGHARLPAVLQQVTPRSLTLYHTISAIH